MKSQPGGCAIAAAAILGLLAAFIWVGQLATVSDLSGSDAAGNGMAQAFGAIEIIVVWLLLAALVVLSGVVGAVPVPALLPALVLIPLSGVAALSAMDLLADPDTPPYLWPIVVSAAVPPLILLFCVWGLVPGIRAAIPAWLAASFVWGATLCLSIAIWPMHQARQAVVVKQQVQSDTWAADFAKLPLDAPLWEWTPFLATRDEYRADAVLKGILQLERRQTDAETMLDRGDFPLLYIGRIDLTPTRAICDKARALLRRRIEPLVLKPGVTKPYAVIRDDVANAAEAIEWLVGYGCPCDAEALAWETMANAYQKTEWDVVRLRRIRDPEELGRTLRENPARFSMLTPTSHLKAWLRFAGDPTLHDQALAGARTVENRTRDAVEILNGTDLDAWDLLIYLPELDLQATPDLCEAALREVHRELGQIYRPKNDDPRPYRELLERMGTGEPLGALIWLSENGCDTEAEVNDAEGLVGAYQDSPARAKMLTTLAGLHRRP